jgi:hypothetical protein
MSFSSSNKYVCFSTKTQKKKKMVNKKQKLNKSSDNHNSKTQLLPELAAEEAAMEREEQLVLLQMQLQEQERFVAQLRAFRDVRMTLTREVQEMMNSNQTARDIIISEKQKENQSLQEQQQQQEEEEVGSTMYESDFDQEDDDDVETNREELPSAEVLENVLQGILSHLEHAKLSLKEVEENEKERSDNEPPVQEKEKISITTEIQQPVSQHIDPNFSIFSAEEEETAKVEQNPSDEFLSSSPARRSGNFGLVAIRVIEQEKGKKSSLSLTPQKSDVEVNDAVVEEDEDIVVVQDDGNLN